MRAHRAASLLVASLVLVVIVGSTIGWVRARQQPPAPDPRAVALVDGSPITADDLDVRLEQILPMSSYHGQVAPDRLLSLKRAALDELVLDELIYREAVAEGRRPPAGDVERELATVKARFESAAQFAAALEENGMTERALAERLARTVVVREARAARARQAITGGDVAGYYRQHAATFQRPERVHLLEILLRADPAQPSSAVSAERKARAILARLRRGEAFDAIARTASEDEYRVKDGDMGFVHRGRLDERFEEAVFAASPGQFAIARTIYGFEVFSVREHEPATQLSLDEARPIIAERLERQRREEAVRAWHARLLASARVEICDPALRQARAAELPTQPAPVPGRPRPAAPARSHQ